MRNPVKGQVYPQAQSVLPWVRNLWPGLLSQSRDTSRSEGRVTWRRRGCLTLPGDPVLPMRTADLGVGLLGMHSACEMMGVKDQVALAQFAKAFFE